MIQATIRQMKALYGDLRTGFVCVDENGGILWLNSAMEEILGTSLSVIENEWIGRWIVDWGQLQGERHGVCTIVRAPKEECRYWIRSHCAVVTETQGYLLEVWDAQEWVQEEREMAVAEASVATRELLRNLAHEIKNPLGGIRGASQLLEASLMDPDDQECAGIIRDEVDRLTGLVDRFLRPYRKKEEASWVSIPEVLEHIRGLFMHAHPRVCFERDYDVSAPRLWLMRGRIRQVFFNLVQNAVEAMAQQEKKSLRLQTRLERDVMLQGRRHRQVYVITVEDNGPGIPPRLKERIFYPLVTGRAEGSGLGLSLVDQFVRRAGGLVRCQSRPGKTVFTVYLPLKKTSGKV